MLRLWGWIGVCLWIVLMASFSSFESSIETVETGEGFSDIGVNFWKQLELKTSPSSKSLSTDVCPVFMALLLLLLLLTAISLPLVEFKWKPVVAKEERLIAVISVIEKFITLFVSPSTIPGVSDLDIKSDAFLLVNGVAEWGNTFGLIGVTRITSDHEAIRDGFSNCSTSTLRAFCSNGWLNVSQGMDWSHEIKLRSELLKPFPSNREENFICPDLRAGEEVAFCWQNSTQDS